MRALLFLLHAAVTKLKMAGDVILSSLWRLNVCGTITTRLLLDATELESLLFNHAKLTEIEYKRPVSILVPVATTWIWIFLSTSF